MDRIAVLIPCYNESQTITKVVTDFRKTLPEAVIYVYDNNSTDGTDELARKAGAVVRYEYQQGKGNVVRRMFQEVEADCYIMVDGDDTYPAVHAREMADKVLQRNADMVVGDRLSSTYFTENKRRFHNSGNTFVRKSINWLFHNSIKDIMTGYRAFSYRFVKTFPVLSHGFEIETEMSIHAVDKNLAVENVIIDYQDRPEGSESKLNTVSDGMKCCARLRGCSAAISRRSSLAQLRHCCSSSACCFSFRFCAPILQTAWFRVFRRWLCADLPRWLPYSAFLQACSCRTLCRKTSRILRCSCSTR